MSSANQVFNGGNFVITNYDTSKLFLRDTRFEVMSYTNSTGVEVTLPAGLILGRIAATEKVLPLVKAATNGSQYPVGILAQNKTVANGVTVNLNVCIKGELDKDLIILPASTDFDDVIEAKTLADRIKSDTLGILLVQGQELTSFDN